LPCASSFSGATRPTWRSGSWSISLADWQREMKLLIKDLHVTCAVAAKGGDWRAMTPRDWGRVGAECRKQYKFLARFAQDIFKRAQEGKPLTSAIAARARLYAGAARATFSRIEQLVEKALGRTEVRWVTDPLVESCPDCLELEARGWMPIEELTQFPGDGSTQCDGNCHCHLEYR